LNTQDRAVSAANSRAAPASEPPAQRCDRQCDIHHIVRFEPVLSSQHPNVMHARLQGV
jgi:hypothetical protein